MRRVSQSLAWRLWRGELGFAGSFLRTVLLPLSGVWRLVTWVRNRRYDRKPPMPVDGVTVVSVGNLAVGGTGKTPFTSWVVGAVSAAGHRPSIVLRGYGRDEVMLHRAWTPTTPVIARSDRRAACAEARLQGADVVVLDDGFQHRRLARTLDIVLLAVEDPFPGPLLPRGPYREPPDALSRADIIVLTRRQATEAQARELEAHVGAFLPDGTPTTASVHLTPGALRNLTSTGMQDPIMVRDPLVVTAVARPHAVLEDARRRTGAGAELMAFEDHHEFSKAETREIRARAGDRTILVTEKDAVKLIPFATTLGDVAVMSQELRWDWGEKAVRARITGAMAGDGAGRRGVEPTPSDRSGDP